MMSGEIGGPVKESQVALSIKKASGSAEKNLCLINTIEERLQKVLRSPSTTLQPQEVTAKEVSEPVMLAVDCNNINSLICSAIDKMRSILDRLEL